MKAFSLKIVVLFSVFCTLGSAASANLIFDDFEAPQGPVVGFNSTSSNDQVGFSLVDFGTATRRISGVAPGVGNFTSVSIDNGGSGQLEVALNNSRFRVAYLSLSPFVNLTSQTSFLLTDVVWTGLAPLNLQILLNQAPDAASPPASNVANAVVTAGDTQVEFFLSDFSNVVLSNVTSLVLRSNPSSPSTGAFAASAIVVTPEPSSLILAGLGLGGLIVGGYIRRRKQLPTMTSA